MHDLVIRGAKIVDGTGKAAFNGDIAVDSGRITSVGGKAGVGRREIDASGMIVAPGFVDVHTHYDGQVTWDPYLTPSSWHGVTTLVMGNCGVGFAPVVPGKEEFLIGLMEGVEDIPGTALAEGITWGWESFGQYLDALDKMPRAVDVGTQVPHGAVRAYVMGERGAHNEEATAEDIARMAAVVREGLVSGALGVSTSRTVLHRAKNGEHVPGTWADERELLGIGRMLGEVVHGVFEMASDLAGPDASMEWMAKLSKETGRPITFAIAQIDQDPTFHLRMMAQARRLNADGANLVPQVAARPAGILMGLQGSLHPFITHPTYKSIAHLPIAERVATMRRLEIRDRILSEHPMTENAFARRMLLNFSKMFQLGEPPDYEPGAEASIAARAARDGIRPEALMYDLLLEREGCELLYMPLFNYADYNLDVTRELMVDPMTMLSLSDGGAHCGVICDASMPSYLLTHWVRDRSRGEKLPLEFAIKRQTSDTARVYGLLDRGMLAPGMKADLNVIDLPAMRLHAPEMVFDLPAGGRRLIQRSEGYRYTIVSGEVTYESSEATGAMPGKLIRGPQRASV